MENQKQFVYSVVNAEEEQQHLEEEQKKDIRRKPNKVYQVKIKLKDVSRDVWRRALIPNGLTFVELHEIIQRLFEWQDKHYYEFEAKGQTIALEVRNGLGLAKLVDQTLIDHYMEKGEKIQYIYDFREEWLHEILVEDIFTKREVRELTYKKFPVCTQMKQPGPLEETRSRLKYGKQTFTSINTRLRLLPFYRGLM